MGDENPIRTLGDYSKPSHEGYRNTIELPAGNNVVPLRSDTIRFRSEDPNQHLKDFLKLVDSLDLDGENRERTRPRLFQFSLSDQASIWLKRLPDERRGNMTKVTPNNAEKLTETETEIPVIEVEKIKEVENKAKSKSIKSSESEEAVEAPSSQPVAYYLKHKINEKLIKELVNNNRFNNSRSRNQVGKKKGKEYKVLLGGPAYDAILKKKITKKEDIRGNFEIPCSIRNLKHVNALVDQRSDMNVMPYSTYMKLTNERPAEIDIRLSLASHSYIYPLGTAEVVLVEVSEHIYLIDFVILDIKENENRPFVLVTPFLTIAKASIKFNTGTITLRSGKHKVSFHRIPDSSNVTDKGVKNDIEPIAPTMTVNRLVLEWEEKIKLYLEREMKFNQ
ncbi:MAK10-like protein [Tanacetum coccineum]|uniref:MAK10-like protein n=1 Tax=Tanacetum coccineum TaxID=301880 RepID=A0ABQ5DDT1_9ASTR